MFRKTIVAIAAAAVLSTAALAPSVASAKGGFGGGGFGGGGFGGGHHGFGMHGFGFALGAIGAAAASDCWQYQLVPTSRGYYKRVLVNTCD
jgi:hypothetical protein